MRPVGTAPSLRFVSLVLVTALVTACGERVGACEGYSQVLSQYFCEDGHNENTCRYLDGIGSNSANWYFHEGQTCAGLGYDLTPVVEELRIPQQVFEAGLRGAGVPETTSTVEVGEAAR